MQKVKKLAFTFLIFAISINANSAFASDLTRFSLTTPAENGILGRIYSQGTSNPAGTVQGVLYVKEARGRGEGTLSGVFSKDSGKTWVSPFVFSNSTGVYNFNIAINRSGEEITVVWVEGGERASLMMRQSFDGGLTWRPQSLIGSDGAFSYVWGLRIEQNSTGSAKVIGFENRSRSQLFIVTTINHGIIWRINAANNPNLKQSYWDIKVSESGSTFAYTYVNYGTPSDRDKLYFSSSQDSGNSWQPEKVITTSSNFSIQSQIISLENQKFIIASELGSELLISTDLGRSFIKRNFPFNNASYVSTALDLATKSIYITFVSADGAVSFSRTNDEGKTWSTPIILPRTSTKMPKLFWSESTRRLALVWPEQLEKQLYFSVSGNQGKNWSNPTPLLADGNRVTNSGVDSDALIAEVLDGNKYVIAWPNYDVADKFSLQATTVNVARLQFNSNGATNGTPPGTQTLISGQFADIPRYNKEFSKPHHEFVHWNTSSDGSGSPVYSGLESIKISQNLEIYAIWKELPKFEITYEGNNVLNSSPLSQSFYSDELAFLQRVDTSLVQRNRVFKEWNTSPDGKGQSFSRDAKGFVLNAPLKLFAIGSNKPTKKVLICTKGKSVKKVLGEKQVCPNGYKKR
jgi:hypothetical protein